MRESVRKAWWDFNVPLEGYVMHMYADVKGLITTGVGNLIDPVQYAVPLNWRKPSGVLAMRNEIIAEWNRVKDDKNAAHMGHTYAARITSLRLREEDVRAMVLLKLASNDMFLSRRFKAWESWPADAQMAIHSLAWAAGTAFVFPKLERALNNEDFVTASVEVKMSEVGNPGLKPRNKANRIMLLNAANVVENGLDKEILFWPTELDVTTQFPVKPITRIDTVLRCAKCSLASCPGDCPEAA